MTGAHQKHCIADLEPVFIGGVIATFVAGGEGRESSSAPISPSAPSFSLISFPRSFPARSILFFTDAFRAKRLLCPRDIWPIGMACTLPPPTSSSALAVAATLASSLRGCFAGSFFEVAISSSSIAILDAARTSEEWKAPAERCVPRCAFVLMILPMMPREVQFLLFAYLSNFYFRPASFTVRIRDARRFATALEK